MSERKMGAFERLEHLINHFERYESIMNDLEKENAIFSILEIWFVLNGGATYTEINYIFSTWNKAPITKDQANTIMGFSKEKASKLLESYGIKAAAK